MKTLLTLSLLLATSTSAFAFNSEQLAKVMQVPAVKAALAGQQIKTVGEGISYRCMGCYGLKIETLTAEEGKVASYQVQFRDFAGRFSASIAKMEDRNAE